MPEGSILGWRQSGIGAALRAVQDKLCESLSAEDFRAEGDTDLEVLTKTFAEWIYRGGGPCYLGAGRVYDLGNKLDLMDIFDLGGLSNAVLYGNGALIRVNSTLAGYYTIFYFYNFQNIKITDLRGEDTGADGTEARGMRFIVADASVGVASDISLDNVTAAGGVTFFAAQGSGRVNGIHIAPNCRSENFYYGATFQDNGDRVRGGLTVINPGRAYFAYGCRDHDFHVTIEHDGVSMPGSNACCVIKRYDNDTENIRLKASFTGTLEWTNLVSIEHQNDDGANSIISNVDVVVNVDDDVVDTGSIRVAFRVYNLDGASKRPRQRKSGRMFGSAAILGRAPPPKTSRPMSNRRSRSIVGIDPATVGATPPYVQAPGFEPTVTYEAAATNAVAFRLAGAEYAVSTAYMLVEVEDLSRNLY